MVHSLFFVFRRKNLVEILLSTFIPFNWRFSNLYAMIGCCFRETHGDFSFTNPLFSLKRVIFSTLFYILLETNLHNPYK